MDLREIEKIRMLTLQAMFSDDNLLGKLALKGGNAIDLIYNVSSRSSLDIDFSINEDFDDIEDTNVRIKNTLEKTFSEHGMTVIDYKFEKKPRLDPENDEMLFWGGYSVEFKVVDDFILTRYKGDRQRLSMMAKDVGPGSLKKFSIDISKHEHCAEKVSFMLDGLTIYHTCPK